MNIWGILQILLTAFETGLCILTCDMVVYDGELVKEHKKYIILWSVIMTIHMACTRRTSFFSWIVFLIQSLGVWTGIMIKQKRNRSLLFAVVLDYNLLTALLDLTLSFMAASYLSESFWNEIYYQISPTRILIYFLTRIIVFGMCLVIKRYKQKYGFGIENYKGVLFSIGIISCV